MFKNGHRNKPSPLSVLTTYAEVTEASKQQMLEFKLGEKSPLKLVKIETKSPTKPSLLYSETPSVFLSEPRPVDRMRASPSDLSWNMYRA